MVAFGQEEAMSLLQSSAFPNWSRDYALGRWNAVLDSSEDGTR